MINNRQAGRRNRGRNNNNGRPSGGNRGGGDSGNRIDSRARGNAVQLLEKYKNMARDAQMAGDRVNAEYYLQFADHYFRVLADNRARQEEQQQRYRRPDESFDDENDDFDVAEDPNDEIRPYQQAERAPEGERRRDEQRDFRENRNYRDRPRRELAEESRAPARGDSEAQQRPAAVEAVGEKPTEAEAPRPRRGRPRKVEAAKTDEAMGLDVAVLPPSIARAEEDGEAAEEAPRKRIRRTRPAAEAAE